MIIACLPFVTGDSPCSFGVPMCSGDWGEEGKLVAWGGREGWKASGVLLSKAAGEHTDFFVSLMVAGNYAEWALLIILFAKSPAPLS